MMSNTSGGFLSSQLCTEGFLSNTFGGFQVIHTFLKLLNHATKLGELRVVPYIFLNLPSVLFNLLRREVGKWIAFIAVVLRLFFPRHFPDWLEMPGLLILLLVVAPNFFIETIRGSWLGMLICLLISCYLLQKHIRASGGFKNSFTQSHGISNTVGIIALLVFPVWALVVHFF
ncbi:hypothetical protein UlMin_045037 [Ulmus minor]